MYYVHDLSSVHKHTHNKNIQEPQEKKKGIKGGNEKREEEEVIIMRAYWHGIV